MSTSSSLRARSPISAATSSYVVVTIDPGRTSSGSGFSSPSTRATISGFIGPGALP